MHVLRRLLFTTVALLSAALVALAAPDPKPDSLVSGTSADLVSPEECQARLDSATEQWHRAVLSGDSKKVDACRSVIDGLIMADLARQVRDLEAKRAVVLAQAALLGDTLTPLSPSRGMEVNAEYAHLLDNFRAKQLVYASYRRSEAFSNKYRLLGDYVDLVRKELGMARLRLAGERVGEDDLYQGNRGRED
jgi:hypothetical protein